MRPSPLFYWSFAAYSASFAKRGCGDDPEDCDLKAFHVNTCRDPKNATEQKGIDEGLLDSLPFFSPFAAAAYWPGNNNSTGDLLKCSGDSCPKVPAGIVRLWRRGSTRQTMSGKAPTSLIITAKTLSQENTSILTIPLGFIAISHMSKLIVLSFRGIGSPKNGAEDFKTDNIDVTEFCKCCQVHHGSQKFWRGISESVIKPLIRLHGKSPNYRIAIVGHPLGGAEAILAAGDITNQGSWLIDNFELYSYRSPRVGNTAAVQYLSQQSDQSYRVTATQDPIPSMPPAMLGYQHTLPEHWIHSNLGNPGPGNVNVLWGYFNSKGASQFDGLHGFSSSLP